MGSHVLFKTESRFMMDKEDILSRSRMENEKNDPYALEVQQKSAVLSGTVTVILATVFFIAQSYLNKGFNFSLYAIIIAYTASDFLSKFFYLKEKKNLALGIFYLLIAITLVFLHFYQLLTDSSLI